MLNKIVLTYGVFCLVFLSCYGQKVNNSKNKESIVIEKERLILFHEDSIVRNSRQELFLQNLGKLMGLPNIKGGYEGLYVRIWLWAAEKKYVISIYKDQLNNGCEIIEFNGEKVDSAEYIRVHKESRNLMPKSGWKNFFSTMEQHRISTLEGGSKQVERKAALTHPAYVQFEIAQPNNYRYYEYLEPSVYRKFDANYEHVHNFLEYFDNQMNVQVYQF